jgi:hypothetical protein
MKKILLGALVVAVAVVFAWRINATEIKEKTKVTTQGDTTVETTKVKAGNVKAETKTTTTPEGTMTEEKMKGKSGKMERKTVDTSMGSAGETKISLKKGALKKLNVDWAYFRQGTEYIIEYNVKDKTDKDLLQELNLTPTQANLIQPGMHRIVSTSPYTAGDVQANFRSIIIKDLKSSLSK